MWKYSGGYIDASNNFVICNVENINKKYCLTRDKNNIIKILKNILFRGNPTWPSFSLREKYHYFNTIRNNKTWHYLSAKQTIWDRTILGNDNGQNPAFDFYKNYLSVYLGKHYLNLVIPEAFISDIVDDDSNEFKDQRVDFYLPELKLVIEIDGIQHLEDQTTLLNDGSRDQYLKDNGCEVIRIPVSDITNGVDNCGLFKKYVSILNQELFDSNDMHRNLNHDMLKKNAVILNSIFRYQILIITLLEEGIVSFEQDIWKFNLINNDEFDCFEEAISDIFDWLDILFQLNGLSLQIPKFIVNKIKEDQISNNDTWITINFSLFRRYTDEIQKFPKVVYIRTDYYYLKDYFKVSIGDTIKYSLSGDENNIKIDSLKKILKNIYNYDTFKEGQLNVIKHVLELNSTIGILPTGGGKSLCYHLPVLLQPRLSIIVAPIKSLMKDQLKNLEKFKYNKIKLINSSLDYAKKNDILDNFINSKYLFVIVSPERFQDKNFMYQIENLYGNNLLSYFVLDEVHCLSEWGHDFRTSYLNLSHILQRNLKGVNIIGLTATASVNVLRDIKKELNIEENNLKTISSLDRKELNFHIISIEGSKYENESKSKYLLNLLNEEIFIDQSNKLNTDYAGIIFTKYVGSVNGCFEISNLLSNILKMDVKFYAGSQPSKFNHENFSAYQEKVQDEFVDNRYNLLVSTKAFGMGINKTNIRFTIHYSAPESLESLYQQAGRAGRDGQKAENYIINFLDDDDENLEKIFNINTNIGDIKEIVHQHIFKGDIQDNIYLWQVGNNDIKVEFEHIRYVLRTINDPKFKNTIKCNELGKADVEKALYRLSVLNIINNWYITKWTKHSEVIELVINKWDNLIIVERLTGFISKYELNFNFDKFIMRSDFINYKKELGINVTDVLENAILVLIMWTFENIIYNRKMQIKTVYDYCINYGKDSDEFKRMLNNYFVFNDFNVILDEMIDDYFLRNKIKNLFFIDTSMDSLELKSKKDLEIIYAQLIRYVESYKNNPLINISFNCCELLLLERDTYNLNRLKDGIIFYQNNNIIEYDILLENILEIGKLMNDKAKEFLSKQLLELFPKNFRLIYDKLLDKYSYVEIIKDINNKLKGIDEVLYE